jgi:hypothetical protein
MIKNPHYQGTKGIRMNNRLKIVIACALFALAIVPASLMAQTAPATSVFNYPGAGVIQAGDVWESFLPQGTTPNYSEAGTATSLGVRRFLQMGNFDRGWTTPATHFPAAFPITPYWFKDAYVMVYEPDTTWNRGPAATNPSFFPISAENGGLANYSFFGYLTYKSTLNGASDPLRKYSIDPYWVDGAQRQHVVYEAAWPTNLGVDVKLRAHGFAAPNWDNLNDYVIVEISLKNTGLLDMDMNGIADTPRVANALKHDIKALAFQIEEQAYMSISSYACGGRCVNDVVPTVYARQAAWVNDPDSTGSPWAFSTVFPSATTLNAVTGSGNVDIGFNGGSTRNYMDLKHGWVMLDVKSGGLPASALHSTASLPSKLTVFGTHPIGLGAQRGWYVSGGSNYWVGSISDPRKMFFATTGVWYANGNTNSHNTDFNSLNLAPNPNFFASGNAGDVLSFVAKGSPARPNGDFKSTDHFDQISYEDGSADATTQYPTGWGKWTLGCSNTENFDVDMFTGVGPFDLKKDSTITLVFATVAGYRLEGIQRSVRAARFTYQSDFSIPKPPPLPDMRLSNTLNKTVAIEWNAAAETDGAFSGYKIWKSSQFKKLSWLAEGMRVVDLYQQQDAVATTRPANLYKPINPKFDAQAKMASNATKGLYQPDTWGTWDLIKVIPKSDLATLSPAQTAGMKYRYEDPSVILGFQYWYYVSAYKDGSFTGPGGDVTGRIETHSTNRNGANGLWLNTFPFGYTNANYPKDATLLKNLGAGQIVGSALAAKGDLSHIGVRPNPYKRYALHDNISQVYDHKIMFYNLPPQCKITILDVSGQVIDVINFVQFNAANGGYAFWDMFSKDGIECASGVYIYVAESPTMNHVGQFAILR